MEDTPAAAVFCGEMCTGCKDDCASCATMSCGDCGGCEHGRELALRGRAATASLALIRIEQPGWHLLEFGFNPNQLRGPDGRFIKMGGRGTAGKGGLAKGSGLKNPRVDGDGRPIGSSGGGAGAGGRDASADTPGRVIARRKYGNGDRVPLADGTEGTVVGGHHLVGGRPGMYVTVRPDGGGKTKEVAVDAIRKRQIKQAEAAETPLADRPDDLAEVIAATRAREAQQDVTVRAEAARAERIAAAAARAELTARRDAERAQRTSQAQVRADTDEYNRQIESTARMIRDEIAYDDTNEGPFTGFLDKYKERELSDRLQELADARDAGNVAMQDRIVAQIRKILLDTEVQLEADLPTVPSATPASAARLEKGSKFEHRGETVTVTGRPYWDPRDSTWVVPTRNARGTGQTVAVPGTRGAGPQIPRG